MDRRFSGEPRTVWKTEPDRPDRIMVLLEDFWFDDGVGERWWAREGETIDGASIPRPLWTLVGSPYTGDYRRASIVHDIACVAAGGDAAARRRADKMFYRACREGGCSVAQSIVLYIGVRIGAWYGRELVEDQGQVRLRRTDLDREIEELWQRASERVLAQGEADDADAIEARTDEALERLQVERAAAHAALA